MSPARLDLVARIREVQFTPVRLREGYDMADVDSFLSEIVRLSTDPASLPGSTIASSTATAHGPSCPVETGSPAAPTTSVVSEQRALVSRLLGRRS